MTVICMSLLNRQLRNLEYSCCCIVRGPDWERVLDVVPVGTELKLQVKMGSWAGCTHSL